MARRPRSMRTGIGSSDRQTRDRSRLRERSSCLHSSASVARPRCQAQERRRGLGSGAAVLEADLDSEPWVSAPADLRRTWRRQCPIAFAAQTAASTRLLSPSFLRICLTWTLMVPTARSSSRAMSLLLQPWASRSRISRSLGVRSAWSGLLGRGASRSARASSSVSWG